jgi:hypothetical protein
MFSCGAVGVLLVVFFLWILSKVEISSVVWISFPVLSGSDKFNSNNHRSSAPEAAIVKAKPAAVVEEARPVAAKGPALMHMSSCTKEKVEAILIHCGRLSLSSSGTGMAASGETGGGDGRRRALETHRGEEELRLRSGEERCR